MKRQQTSRHGILPIAAIALSLLPATAQSGRAIAETLATINAPVSGAIVEAKEPSKAPEGLAADEIQRIASTMGNVERINVRIPGLAALSGEYRVGGDGTISLPGIGRLHVADATIEQLEARIAEEILRVSHRENSVSVEVIDYRPIFVSGVVVHAGSFPWKPGISVLQAETLAGGVFRGTFTSTTTGVTATTDHERERAVRSAYELAATIASIERLEAEKTGSTHFVLPARVASLVSKSEQESLIAAQMATLESRVGVFNAKIAAAENAKAIAIKERRALEDQLVRIGDQLTKRRELLKKIEYMTEHRYARGDRLFDEQVRVATLEERLTTTTLAISRAEAAATAAQHDLDTAVLGRRADIDTQLLTLEQKKAAIEIQMESASEAYRRVTGQDAITSRVSAPMVPQYQIVRSLAGRSTMIPATSATPLLPGDVVVVSLGRADAS